MIQQVEETWFNEEVLHSDVPVLLDFYGDWCPPCRKLSPILDELSAESDGRYKIVKLNVREHPGLTVHFNVAVLPTMYVLNGGSIVESIVGLQSKATLLEALERASAEALPRWTLLRILEAVR